MPLGGRQEELTTAVTAVRCLIQLGHTLDRALDLALSETNSDLRDEVARRIRQHESGAITFRRTSVLTRQGGRRPWFGQYDPASGYHWPRLRSWLLTGGRFDTATVESLDDASDRVLEHLEDPRPDGPETFRVQGLVLGRVQSGKTANYTAVIAKAVDAGYRFVIVLAGVHNSLRQQTQQRLTDELGLEGSQGVGEPEAGKHWISLTTNSYDGDFRSGTVDANVLQGSSIVIAVVKKNTSVLKRLLQWTSRRPTLVKLPVLIIDDEADNASINTRGNRPPSELVDIAIEDADETLEEDLSPSTINRLIRQLISGFETVSYIAYTATPFANVLIDPDATDTEVADDLYPGDFIISLPTPSNYVGPQRLFGVYPSADETDWEPSEELDIVRIVSDLDSFLISEASLPPSLRLALTDFILAAAAKESRLGPGWATLLVHTTHRINEQNALGGHIAEEITRIRASWRYGEPSDRRIFAQRWETEFLPYLSSHDDAPEMTSPRNSHSIKAPISFENIESSIDRIFRRGIRTVVLNSSSEDELEYRNVQSGIVVVIGGNRLSRGLTLEGLLSSYFVRNSHNYDTLLQMGRWFGYRDAYIDLTRLWTTCTIYSHFRHLALVEEDLRDQIAAYEEMGRTPRDFAPLILAHPDLGVTAPNRIGAGREYKISYAGQLVQSVRFELDNATWLEDNLSATTDFISHLGRPSRPDLERPDRKPHWNNIDWRLVVDYLRHFSSPLEANSFHPDDLAEYISGQAESHAELTSWWISIRARERFDTALGSVDLAGDVGSVNAISRTRLTADPMSVGVLTTPAHPSGSHRTGEETIGLTDGQIEEARRSFSDSLYQRYGTTLRRQRSPNQGLLCIFPISAHSSPSERSRTRRRLDPAGGVPVIGLSVVFPFSTTASSSNYVGGPTADPTLR